jgi:hypothetical protein
MYLSGRYERGFFGEKLFEDSAIGEYTLSLLPRMQRHGKLQRSTLLPHTHTTLHTTEPFERLALRD